MRPPCDPGDVRLPSEGGIIRHGEGGLEVPDSPVIAFIKGDGVGPEVVESARRVLDAAVKAVYGGRRRIVWWELVAGKEAFELCGSYLPEATLLGLKAVRASIKGPLETPVGGGFRSLNVSIRQALDLFANVRPVKYYGQPAPHKYADKVDFVIFRENTEDVYAGIEWPHDSSEASLIRGFLREKLGIDIREDAGIGLKPISRGATIRIVKVAIDWALRNGLTRVTIMHKGNIMKYTEGSFMRWAYEYALKAYREVIVTEDEVKSSYGGVIPEGKILLNDRIADNMLQQIITRPWEYQVIVAPNLNGDYISDAASALVGGIGMAAGINMGEGIAVAEPVHGTAQKYAGKDLINPTAEILSGALLLGDFLGWGRVKEVIENAIRNAIRDKKVTQDLARHMEGVSSLRTSEYTEALIGYIEELSTSGSI